MWAAAHADGGRHPRMKHLIHLHSSAQRSENSDATTRNIRGIRARRASLRRPDGGTDTSVRFVDLRVETSPALCVPLRSRRKRAFMDSDGT